MALLLKLLTIAAILVSTSYLSCTNVFSSFYRHRCNPSSMIPTRVSSSLLCLKQLSLRASKKKHVQQAPAVHSAPTWPSIEKSALEIVEKGKSTLGAVAPQSLPDFTKPVNFAIVPKGGIAVSNKQLTLRGAKKTSWYYLSPNIGSGSMSTLQFVDRMTSKFLVPRTNMSKSTSAYVGELYMFEQSTCCESH